MGLARLDQSNFTQGQLDPRVLARTDWESYYKAAKELTNCLVIPQGGVQRRWGTKFVSSIGLNIELQYVELSTFIYNDNIIYLMQWEAGLINVYLENILVSTIVTQYAQEDISTLRFSQVQTRVIVTSGNYQPQEIKRSADAPAAITAFSGVNNTLTANTGYAAGKVLPVRFTTTTSLPVTNPQIFAGRDYFMKTLAANTFKIFSTSEDAKSGLNFYTITSAGVNSNVVVQNTWAINNITFKNYPTYDFDGGYTTAAFTFTPSATTGTITLTASGNIFTAAMVGGVYTGNGGIVRLTVFTNATHMTGVTIVPFPNTTAINGLLSYLAEPAWSDARGWPSVSSFIQNRLIFANTSLLPSGQWLSVVNDVYNFDDSQILADDSISNYPESGTMSVIQSMTSARSMVVHTNTGNYSSPVQTEIVLTPTSYLLTEQNKYGVGNLQPVFIDNQIFFVDRSGNNVINMIWEFSQSSYTDNSVSVKASNLIKKPVDMSAFFEPNFIDGFFVIFVNNDGTLAILQTLHEENILAFSNAHSLSNVVIDQNNHFSNSAASYIRVVSAQNRCWFLVNREIPSALRDTLITNFNGVNNTLHAVGSDVGVAKLARFTTTGTLPNTSPSLEADKWYWVTSTSADDFKIYSSALDAETTTNPFAIFDAGLNTTIHTFVQIRLQYIEEVDFSVYTDSSVTVTNAAPQTVITGLGNLEGMVVNVVGDGVLLQNNVVLNGQITIERASTVVNVGLPMSSTFVPLPPALPGIPGSLYQPRHIRNLYVNYYQTVGAEIQSYGIPVANLQDVVVGQVPTPQDGVFEYTLMEGWEGSKTTDIQIVQNLPLPMTIIALSYILEIPATSSSSSRY